MTDVPKEHVDAVEKARNELIQQVSNLDDEVAEAVLEEREITPELLKAGIRRQTIANKFVPVIGGSALKNIGIQYLVDAVVDYLPSPLDIPPAKGQNPDTGEPMEAMTDDNGDVLFHRVQAVERSVCRETGVLPRLFRHPQQRRHCLQSAHEQT